MASLGWQDLGILVLTPPPQEALQSLHSIQSQVPIGHASSLQDSSRMGTALQREFSGTQEFGVLVLFPPPQDTLQSLHGFQFHWPCEHVFSLQASFIIGTSLQLAPSGEHCSAVFILTPPPHE